MPKLSLKQAACCQAPRRTGMEVHGSLGPLGQGHTSASSHPSAACATAPPLLLENEPERPEGENQLKSSPCLSQAPHCQRISISPKKGLQSQPSPLKPSCLARKTGAGCLWGFLARPLRPGKGHRSSDVKEQEFSLTQFRSAARQAQTASLSPCHSQKNERQREAGSRVDE